MKKFFILIAVLFFVPASSSDIFVNNATIYDLYYKIGAKPSNGNDYPFLYSLGPVSGHFVYLASSPAIYTNVGGFPFDSPSTLPIITNWERRLTAGSPWVSTTSALAQSMFGTTHRFCEFKFYLEESGIVVGSGNIDPIDLDEFIDIPLEILSEEDTWVLASYIPLGDDVFILFDPI